MNEMAFFYVGRQTPHCFEVHDRLETAEEAVICFRQIIGTVSNPEEIRIMRNFQIRKDLEALVEL